MEMNAVREHCFPWAPKPDGGKDFGITFFVGVLLADKSELVDCLGGMRLDVTIVFSGESAETLE
jgi:hypothetical protein